MVSTRREQIYVAELKLPSCFYTTGNPSFSIPDPEGIGFNRGYFRVRSPDEQSAIDAHPELVFTIEYVSANLKEAEDHAFTIGGLLSSIASAYGGYPLGVPHLDRIASVDFDGKMMSQHNYLYI